MKNFIPVNARHIDRKKYRNRKWLYKKYIEEGLTGTDIGKIIGCNRHTVVRWIRELGISVRNESAAHRCKGYYQKMSGKNHPNYKDGKRAIISGWGYRIRTLKYDELDKHRHDKQWRVPEHVYIMENFINRSLTKREIVHHKDFDRMNNNIENLILFSNHSNHNKYHKYLERMGVYHLGLIKKKPKYKFSDGTVVGTQS